MPSHHLPRWDSWPPTIVHLPSSSSTSASIPDIDENPFSYFLEPDDPDPDFPLDLSAGIETSSSRPTKVREISPSSLQRLPPSRDSERDRELARLEHDMHVWLAAPLSLREHPPTSSRSHNTLAPPPPPARGRGAQRLAPSGGRGRTRSLSAQRPHSWREPSPEIERIEEADEEGAGREREATPGLSDAATEGEEVEGGRRKVKKRVRWALPDEN